MRENLKSARKATGLTQQQVAEKRNLNWVILAIPENCHNIFICMDEKLFDEKTKNGMIPLHDDRNYGGQVSMPCFIGYQREEQNILCTVSCYGKSHKRKGDKN